MRNTAILSILFWSASSALLLGCEEEPKTPANPIASASTPAATLAPPPTASAPTTPQPVRYDMLTRDKLNRNAVRRNLPLYWVADKNSNKAVDPDEIASLLFYGREPKWVDGGRFTPELEAAYKELVAANVTPPVEDATRESLVIAELEQGVATLVYNDLRGLSEADKEFSRHILAASKLIDDLFATQRGMTALRAQVAEGDAASQSLFRRNWGPKCVAPKTEQNPVCSAIAGAPKPVFDVYPEAVQTDPKFCETLEKNADAKRLLEPFTAVRTKDGKLVAVSYAEAFKEPMLAISRELEAAGKALTDPSEGPLRAYVAAAAKSFTDNNWLPADEAWSKMNATSSKWYLRIGPDEVYWEPCSHKAGFHTTFARINPDSLEWQRKLTPVQTEMEQTLAALIGNPYRARRVTFHLPDFIDIVVNAGDDRAALGATIGQSLPNWGPVANEGRGRTVAMSNLYTDADSVRRRRTQAESLVTRESMQAYSDNARASLLSTILHEATHNLGPAHEYAFHGKTDQQAFGGGLASMLEELKAQTGALYYVEMLRKKGIIDDARAKESYTDAIVWSFGHVAEGMWTADKKRKAYAQLSAIQVGFLIDEGALAFDAAAKAANGTDTGAFVIHFDKMPAAVEKMMKRVGAIKASNDKAAAEALSDKYVDGTVVPHKVISERYRRTPKASFVYAVDL